MKKQLSKLCILAFLISVVTEPAAVNASSYPAGKMFLASETPADVVPDFSVIDVSGTEAPISTDSPASPDISSVPDITTVPDTTTIPDTTTVPASAAIIPPATPVASVTPATPPAISATPGLPEESKNPTDIVPVKFAVNTKLADYKNKTITLKWKTISNAHEYVIMQKNGSKWEETNTTQKTKKNISVKKYGKKVTYKVQAFDTGKHIIGESAKIKVLIPKKAEKLHTTAITNTKVKLEWAESKGAGFYNVYQKKEKRDYHLVKSIKNTNINLEVKNNKVYSFKIVPVYKNSAGTIKSKAGKVNFYNKEFVSLQHQKYTYNEMESDIKSLCQKYSGYVSYEIAGYSEKGRKIYDVILGNQKAGKTILVVSTLHGREYIATAVCMKQLEYYLLNYNKTIDGKKLSKVFGECNVHYIMMANPDGVTISQTSSSRWKGNANGVNLNLNFPYSFKHGGSRSDNSYSGRSAASEKETQVVIKLTKKLKKTQTLAVVNYHAMGSIVFGDYGGRNPGLRSDIREMYSIARNTTGYADAGGYSGTSNGNYREYLMYGLKIPSVTLEVASVSCPVPQYQYIPTFNRNKLVVLREASWLSKKKTKK